LGNAPGNLRYGCIIWALLSDRNGVQKKRPAVVITPTDEIGDDLPLFVVAITSRLPRGDLPPWHVELPWNQSRRQVCTGLYVRSAAVVTWIQQISLRDVLDIQGRVPTATMDRIQRELERLEQSQ
jgi:mRNA-degrading endonuclease toxin of MazEF toxin-antitoxin module